MVYVILVFVGFAMMALGVYTLEENKLGFSNRNLAGSLLMFIGAALMIVGLYMTKPVEAKATELALSEIGSDEEIDLNEWCVPVDYPTAGAVKYMNIITYQSMQDEVPDISEDDIDLLARLITAEQGYAQNYDNESEYERRLYLTGSVVINRIKSEDFPNTLQEVIYQHNGEHYQYQCVKNGHIERDYDEIAWEVAEELLVYGTNIPENVVFQAEFEQGDDVYEQIGRTYFCYQ